MWTGCEAVGGGDEARRVKAEGGQVLERGGCESRNKDKSISGVGGAELERRGGETLAVGGRGKVPIKTSRAISTHGGAGRADFAKASLSQSGAGEVHPLGAGGAL